MGITNMLQPYLDVLEYETLTEESFLQNFSALKEVSQASIIEARTFQASLS